MGFTYGTWILLREGCLFDQMHLLWSLREVVLRQRDEDEIGGGEGVYNGHVGA